MSEDEHTSSAHASHDAPDALGAKIGMWLFLLTELVLFGTLFIAFANYYTKYPLDYHAAARLLDRGIGALNTVVLLTSSLTMVLGVWSLGQRREKRAVFWLLVTIGLGLVFLVVKGFEWSHKFEIGIYLQSERLLERAQGEIIFFGMYFLMTGLHALHVVIGMVLLAVVVLKIRGGKVAPERPTLIENVGLYWHIVDVIWIYLFPLFYLASR
jgi:cytochrome c oxidase subunit 3